MEQADAQARLLAWAGRHGPPPESLQHSQAKRLMRLGTHTRQATETLMFYWRVEEFLLAPKKGLLNAAHMACDETMPSRLGWCLPPACCLQSLAATPFKLDVNKLLPNDTTSSLAQTKPWSALGLGLAVERLLRPVPLCCLLECGHVLDVQAWAGSFSLSFGIYHWPRSCRFGSPASPFWRKCAVPSRPVPLKRSSLRRRYPPWSSCAPAHVSSFSPGKGVNPASGKHCPNP